MTDRFNYDFGDGRGPIPARHHLNGGGIVEISAEVSVAPTAYVHPTVRLFGNVRVGVRASLDYEVEVGVGAHGLRFWVGCQRGIRADRFKQLVVETRAGTGHDIDYIHAIDFVEKWARPRGG